jgi:tRNA nucleotidyltransferase (CCA-adding enzyme)
MPDYMYLLESRLSPEQRAALVRVQELARAQESNVYLTGGAVRDLISGMPLRDLDFTIEGNPARIVHELEKGGARIVFESEKLRHYELIFAGDVDGSISAARDDVYDRPGAKPEIRWSTVMEDLRRRDLSINAIAISLNANSRGLLLDPTNGLADLEKHEVRTLSIHAFTNQPIRLLRILRYCARMGFKMEARTAEWFDLAMERGLHETIGGGDVGQEIRQLGREDNPTAILKAWESRGLLGRIHPHLPQRRPDYDSLAKLSRARENLFAAGLRPRLSAPVTYFLFGRLKSRERSAALRHLELRAAELDAVVNLPEETEKVLQFLKGRKTKAPRDAYFYLAGIPLDLLAFLQAEYPNPRAQSKIRNYLTKWRPLRMALPVAELDSLGIPRGAKFDKILEDFFERQLRGKGRTPEDRTKLLRKLAGIKEEPKKKLIPEKKKNKEKLMEGAAAKAKAAAESGVPRAAAKGTPPPKPAKTPAPKPAPAPAARVAKKTASKAKKTARSRPPARKRAPRPKKSKPAKRARHR